MESSVASISLELLGDTYEALAELAQSRGWSIEEAARLMIDEGIASIRAGETLQKIDDLSDAQKVRRLLGMLKDAESDYASLKFQNHVFFRDNKTLQLNLVGYKSKVASLETYISELKAEIAQIRNRQEEQPTG